MLLFCLFIRTVVETDSSETKTETETDKLFRDRGHDVTGRRLIAERKLHGTLTMHAGTLPPRIASCTNPCDVVDPNVTSCLGNSFFFLSQTPNFFIRHPLQSACRHETDSGRGFDPVFFFSKKNSLGLWTKPTLPIESHGEGERL